MINCQQCKSIVQATDLRISEFNTVILTGICNHGHLPMSTAEHVPLSNDLRAALIAKVRVSQLKEDK